jgi:hypothetical protein
MKSMSISDQAALVGLGVQVQQRLASASGRDPHLAGEKVCIQAIPDARVGVGRSAPADGVRVVTPASTPAPAVEASSCVGDLPDCSSTEASASGP